MTDRQIKNARILEAFVMIDEKYIGEVAASLNLDDFSEELPKPSIWKSLKYVLALAACVLLLGALFPVINHTVRNLPLIFPGIFGDSTTGTDEMPETEYEYPLSEEELAAVNEAWSKKKGDGSIFAESRESLKWWRDKLCPVEFGDCVLAKYGKSIVLCRHQEGNMRTREVIEDCELWFEHPCEIWVCHAGTYYTVQEAYDGRFLTKDQVAELEALQLDHNNYYSRDNYAPENPSYLKFMHELEPLTKEQMIEIERAYVQFCYDRSFNAELANNKELGYGKGRSEFNAYYSSSYNYMRRGLLFADKHEHYRYYGIVNGYAVFTVINEELAIKTYELAGQTIYFPIKTVMYVYADGEVLPLRNAYFDGLLKDEDIVEIAKRHELYCKYLNIDFVKPQITVEKTVPKYPEFEGVEPLTESEMYEIREAWAKYWYDSTYKRNLIMNRARNYSDEELALQMTVEELEGFYEKTREALFNEKEYYSQRYYGKFGDCVILARLGGLATVKEYVIEGKEYWAQTPGIFVYRNGEIFDLMQAYENGWLNIDQIDEIFNVRFPRYRDKVL